MEGWHYALQSLFACHHPTIWTFLHGLKKDIQQQKAAFVQATAGVVHQRSRKFRILNERIVRAVATFGQSEILVYLRSIAHFSHC